MLAQTKTSCVLVAFFSGFVATIEKSLMANEARQEEFETIWFSGEQTLMPVELIWRT